MTDQADRHATRMAKKKAVIDANIAKADKEKGLLLVLTGNGKGKSSSAFGMVARALGHGMKVGVAQFIKGRSDTGEEAFFSKQPGVEWHVLGEGFTWDTQNLERDMATAKQGWAIAQKMLADPGIGLVVLDELTYLVTYGILAEAEVIKLLAMRPPRLHVLITGRAASAGLIAAADLVTEMREIKHPYKIGIQARKGIEW